MPRAKMLIISRAPPVNMFTSPIRPPPAPPTICDIAAPLTSGTVMNTPRRYRAKTPRVKRIRRRSSGILVMSVNFVATLDVLCGAPGGLDFLSSRRTKPVYAYGQRLGQFARAKNLNLIARSFDKSFGAQRLFVDAIACFKDSLQVTNVHRDHGFSVDVGETNLGKTTRQGRLTTLKLRMDTSTASRVLSLLTTATCFAPTTTGTTANSLPLFVRPFGRLKIAEIHGLTLQFFNTNQMRDLIDHPANRRRVFDDYYLMSFAQSESLDRAQLAGGQTRQATLKFYL